MIESIIATIDAESPNGQPFVRPDEWKEIKEVIVRLQRQRDEAYETCAKIAEKHGEPYALNTSTGAMVFRGVTSKIAADIRALSSQGRPSEQSEAAHPAGQDPLEKV